MRYIMLFVFALIALCNCHPVFAADCEQALFNPDYGVFAHEGGYQNDPGDPGNFRGGKNCGGTKYGISCRYNPGIDIKNLTKDKATLIYQNNQCSVLRMGSLKGQRVPTLMLDLAVNMGTETAVKFIIKTLDIMEGVKYDPKTKPYMTSDIINRYNSYTEDFHKRREFLFGLVLVAIDHYCDIVESNPKMAKWLLGWIIRVNPLND